MSTRQCLTPHSECNFYFIEIGVKVTRINKWSTFKMHLENLKYNDTNFSLKMLQNKDKAYGEKHHVTWLNFILSSKFKYTWIDYHSLILIFFVFGTCLIVKEIRVLFLGSTLLDSGLLGRPERPKPCLIRSLFISSGCSTLLVNVSSLASFIPWRYLNITEVYYITFWLFNNCININKNYIWKILNFLFWTYLIIQLIWEY